MTKSEAIQRACSIIGHTHQAIGNHDGYTHATDCFCGSLDDRYYQNDGFVLDYIESAVKEKLDRDGHTES